MVMRAAQRLDLFVVDGLNDFCASGTEPLDWPWPSGGRRRGSLFVEGADKEAVNVAEMIKRLGTRIYTIHAMIDSHHRNDGSHNIAWKDSQGNSPPPFTIVTHADVLAQKYVPRFPVGIWEGKRITSLQWALNYTKALEDKGRNPLCLWPVHCEIGTWGQCFYHPLREAFDDWTKETCQWINFVSKGSWVWTEHYSGIRADVPDPTRPETQLNTDLINSAAQADIIAWTGWAGSHCLRWTALDAINHFGQGSNDFIKKSVFFEDASAAVPNVPGGPDFAQWRQDFLNEVSKRGGTVTTTKKFLA